MKKIDLEKNVITFLKENLMFSFLKILVSILVRIFRLLTLVSVIKFFFLTVNPNSASKFVNEFIVKLGLTIDNYSPNEAIFVVLLIILSIVGLDFFLRSISRGFDLKIERIVEKIFYSTDYKFFNSMNNKIKSLFVVLEVSVFSIIVLSFLFYLNMMVGISVAFAFLLFAIINFKNSKERKIIQGNIRTIDNILKKQDRGDESKKIFNNRLIIKRRSIRLTDYNHTLGIFFSLFVILVFFEFDGYNDFDPAFGLALIFGVRHVLGYAVEASRAMANIKSNIYM
jgi:hypothetical protein